MGSLKSRQPEPLGGQTPPRLDVGTMDRDPSEEDSKYSGEGAGEGAGRPPLQPVWGRVLPLRSVCVADSVPSFLPSAGVVKPICILQAVSSIVCLWAMGKDGRKLR